MVIVANMRVLGKKTTGGGGAFRVKATLNKHNEFDLFSPLRERLHYS